MANGDDPGVRTSGACARAPPGRRTGAYGRQRCMPEVRVVADAQVRMAEDADLPGLWSVVQARADNPEAFGWGASLSPGSRGHASMASGGCNGRRRRRPWASMNGWD